MERSASPVTDRQIAVWRENVRTDDDVTKWMLDMALARIDALTRERDDLRARLAKAEAVLATVRHWKAGPSRNEPCWCGAVEERSHHRWCRILLSTYRKAAGTVGGKAEGGTDG